MKKLIPLFLLTALLLCGCADMGKPADFTKVSTTTAVTEDPRDVLTNPEALTPIQLEITKATWKNHRELLQNSPVLSDITIDKVAAHISQTFLAPCGKGYVVFDYAFIPVGMMYTQELIGSYEFRYTTTQQLSYYEDGEFFDLEDAYAAELFTDDDIRVVWEAYIESLSEREKADLY